MEQIAFDDVEALSARVSPEFGCFGPPMLVSQQMIDDFADLTGDHQWIHVDVERSERESPFGGPIAHGFLTLSLVPTLVSTIVGRLEIVGMGSVVNYGSDALRFIAPVPAGSKVHGRERIKAVERAPRGTRIVREIAVHVVGSEKPALVYDMITLYQPTR